MHGYLCVTKILQSKFIEIILKSLKIKFFFWVIDGMTTVWRAVDFGGKDFSD